MAEADKKYRYEQDERSGYETLYRPDGTEVTWITEPEDRNFCRDLSPVIDELNKLLTHIDALAERERELAQALEDWVLHFGPIHDPDCPMDDTCNCSGKESNDKANRLLSEYEGKDKVKHDRD